MDIQFMLHCLGTMTEKEIRRRMGWALRMKIWLLIWILNFLLYETSWKEMLIPQLKMKFRLKGDFFCWNSLKMWVNLCNFILKVLVPSGFFFAYLYFGETRSCLIPLQCGKLFQKFSIQRTINIERKLSRTENTAVI